MTDRLAAPQMYSKERRARNCNGPFRLSSAFRLFRT
jgi:hypothetical protein